MASTTQWLVRTDSPQFSADFAGSLEGRLERAEADYADGGKGNAGHTGGGQDNKVARSYAEEI